MPCLKLSRKGSANFIYLADCLFFAETLTLMQVKKIKALFEDYSQYLAKADADEYLHLWNTQANFGAHFDLEERDLGEMLDRALQNSATQRIWNRQAYEPKKILIQFAELFPDYITQMFNDLFNEDKSVESRMQRFAFYWDQLLDAYRTEHPQTKLNQHYHDDGYEITSYYLCFRYPEEYIPYQFERFQLFLQKVGSHDIPQAHDIPRYFKLAKTLRKLMEKEVELLAAHQQRLQSVPGAEPESLLLIFDFLLYSTREMPYYY